MYKSPIDLIYKDVLYHMEENIYTAVQNVGIQVDRDELIKALEYDRGQYEKGYEDAKAERQKGEWEEERVFDDLVIEQWQSARCCVCGLYHTTPFSYYFSRYNYCPNCGADMRGEEK